MKEYFNLACLWGNNLENRSQRKCWSWISSWILVGLWERGHRAIIFSSQVELSIWKALKKSSNQPESDNNNGDDKNKDE